jgi:predicted nucleic acid-binding protein
MTVVVADTSPLNYLLLIGEISVLPALYGQIVIPQEVMTELSDQLTTTRRIEFGPDTAEMAYRFVALE